MKTISIDFLRSHPDGNLWHRAWSEGKSKDGVNIEVPDDFPLTEPMKLRRLALSIPQQVSLSVIDSRQSACSVCEWNIDWLCQHAGCMPCKQRAAGGLKEAIKLDTFRCPAGKVV